MELSRHSTRWVDGRRAPVQGLPRAYRKVIAAIRLSHKIHSGEYSEPSYKAEAKDCNLVYFGFAGRRDWLA
jgi:hypothetical protein